ncbi:SRPBCC family protein [Pseudonocardia thermophila]|uniref:SRPBCC family protein n=1 Tax=Pseudonocardia thermophila TaxID=1848 RepID=UPI00248EE960|nr:SRPBCC family protein [Pseudonocardia thermophila]
MTAELTLTVDVAAPAGVVWDVVTDWPAQGEWMLATRVTVDDGTDGRRSGAALTAVTGVGPLSVRDPMVITEWDPPRRCVVRHTGSVVRGSGVFEVVPLGPERARIVWSELLDLPFGVFGRGGWPLVRPALRAGVARSLRAVARRCAERHRGEGRGADG